jgi:hypothetical protein
MVRKNQAVETRLVAEYLAATYPKFPSITAQPLGVISTDLQAQVGYAKAMGISRPFRPEVDALVILPNNIVLIEAKVWNIVNGLAKLPLYKSLLPITPELKQYFPREIIMELVVGWTNPNLQAMARDQGVVVKLFCPDWLVEVVDGYQRYWTKEYRDTRAQKLALREMYGIE